MAARSARRGAPGGSPTSAWPAFITAYAVLIARVEEHLKTAQLPELAWYDVLWALEQADQRRLRMHELAETVLISRSNITRLVDRLEGEGLVRREPCPDDRRSSFAVLTEAGRRLRKRIWPVYQAAIESHFDSHLSDAEQATLRSVCARLLQAASKL